MTRLCIPLSGNSSGSFKCKTASMGIIIRIIMLKGAHTTHTEWMRIRIAKGYRSTFPSFQITTRIIHVFFCAGGRWWSLRGKFMSVHLSRKRRRCDRRLSCSCPRRKSKVIAGNAQVQEISWNYKEHLQRRSVSPPSEEQFPGTQTFLMITLISSLFTLKRTNVFNFSIAFSDNSPR